MSQRTYKEAVKISVDYWVEKSFKTPLNQNNGDKSTNGDMSFMLMNMLSLDSQKNVTFEQIEKFKSKLTEILLEHEGQGRGANELDVDYDPNENLAQACKFAQISTSCLPCKTFTFIDNDNKVIGRYQYGGDRFEL